MMAVPRKRSTHKSRNWRSLRPLILFLLCTPLPGPLAFGEGRLTIASAAGYKNPVTALARGFSQERAIQTDLIFANMRQIIAQTRMSGRVDIIIGERAFLESSGLRFCRITDLGKGHMVLAWRKGIHLEKPMGLASLKAPQVSRIGIADPDKAIYGKAAMESLCSSGLETELKGKLLHLSTVPQVSAYLVSGDIDAGFINESDAIRLQQSIGGFIPVNALLYQPIIIQAATLEADSLDPSAIQFQDFLQDNGPKELFHLYGLKP